MHDVVSFMILNVLNYGFKKGILSVFPNEMPDEAEVIKAIP